MLQTKSETLAERIQDETKTPLAGSFILWLKNMAVKNRLHENEIWTRWRQYAALCDAADQSPVFFEFCAWNDLQEVN